MFVLGVKMPTTPAKDLYPSLGILVNNRVATAKLSLFRLISKLERENNRRGGAATEESEKSGKSEVSEPGPGCILLKIVYFHSFYRKLITLEALLVNFAIN